ncbi:MAG TPA: arginase family protein, partial [Nitrosopumilaceae archaeon]|nr:arginase family protein [Nitrosopumilaceae archaeon]
MSFLDLYMSKSPLIASPNDAGESSVIVYGVPFDSTHSFRPGTRFGPDAIRLALNNIEIFSTRFNVDLESIHIED